MRLFEICKGWNITELGYRGYRADNPTKGAKVISINAPERLISIPDMSWSEYCDFECAEYGTFCEITFANQDLAQEHREKFAKHGDVKLLSHDNTTVTHGPRSLLHNFREELMDVMEYSQELAVDTCDVEHKAPATINLAKLFTPKIEIHDADKLTLEVLDITINEFNNKYEGQYKIIEGKNRMNGKPVGLSGFWIVNNSHNEMCAMLWRDNNQLYETIWSQGKYNFIAKLSGNNSYLLRY